jgi:hypothetical protein
MLLEIINTVSTVVLTISYAIMYIVIIIAALFVGNILWNLLKIEIVQSILVIIAFVYFYGFIAIVFFAIGF